MKTNSKNVKIHDTCGRWFRRFNSDDFDLTNKERLVQPKSLKYHEFLETGETVSTVKN